MKKTRILSLVLAMLIIVCVFSACKPSDTTKDTSGTSADTGSGGTSATDGSKSNFNETGYPIVNEKITLKMMGSTNVSMLDDWSQVYFFQHMEELTNIALQYDVVNTDGFAMRKALAFAGGDLPDFFFKASPAFNNAEALDYGSQGLLVDLNEWVEQYGPNLMNMFAERPEARAVSTSADGGMYTLPYVYDRNSFPAYFINTKWLDALDIEMPTNLDDFYTVMKAFKEKDPNGNNIADEIPFSGTCGSGSVQNLTDFAMNFGIFMQHDAGYYFYLDDKLTYAPTTDEYKEYLLYMRKLYDEELLDNNIFVQDLNQVKAKGEQGLLGVVNCWAAYTRVGLDRDLDYFVIEPFKAANGRQIWHGDTGVSAGVFAITHKNEHIPETIRWIDYCYDKNDGGLIAARGVEGVHWEWKDETKTQWHSLMPDEWEGRNAEWQATYSVQPGGNVPIYLNTKFTRMGELDEHDDILFACYEVTDKYATLAMPIVAYNDEDTKRLASISADINTQVKVMLASFITREASIENDWDKYVNDLYSMGLEEYTQIKQRAVDAALIK